MFKNRFFKFLVLGSFLAVATFVILDTAAEASKASSVDYTFHTPPMSDYQPVDHAFHTPPMSDYQPVDHTFHTPPMSDYTP